MEFCRTSGKPYMILQPCYVYMKPYYEPSLLMDKAVGSKREPFYVTPSMRYMYVDAASIASFVPSASRLFPTHLCCSPASCARFHPLVLRVYCPSMSCTTVLGAHTCTLFPLSQPCSGTWCLAKNAPATCTADATCLKRNPFCSCEVAVDNDASTLGGRTISPPVC
jgi:hypothetical protein